MSLRTDKDCIAPLEIPDMFMSQLGAQKTTSRLTGGYVQQSKAF